MKSDLELQQEVLAELRWDPSVDAAHIDLVVSHGVVSLTGHVGSDAEKRSAELAARRVAGVAALEDRLDVVPDDNHHPTDSDISLDCERALRWASGLPNTGVKVVVEDGRLTLTGIVPGDFQRRAAVTAVRDIPGVIGIVDKILLVHAGPADVGASDGAITPGGSDHIAVPQPGPPEPGDAVNVSSWPCGSMPRSHAAPLLHRRPFRVR